MLISEKKHRRGVGGLRSGQVFVGQVLRVVDGDTILVRVDCVCFSVSIDVRVRLKGVFAPELSTADGKVAFERLRRALEGKTVRLTYWKVDRYGRAVCDVETV